MKLGVTFLALSLLCSLLGKTRPPSMASLITGQSTSIQQLLILPLSALNSSAASFSTPNVSTASRPDVVSVSFMTLAAANDACASTLLAAHLSLA